mmetsp:Transcript_23416/g.41618  ORF Transcript_23416/g.41618 Transcript_23416/m.41618 type:complete len:410 (-) Transcript_23416:1258-2487(-)
MPDSLSHERNGTGCTGVGLNDVGHIILNGELDVDETNDLQLLGNLGGPALDDLKDGGTDGLGGEGTGRVTRVNTGLLNVLHHTGNHDIAILIAEGINIHFHRAIEVLVNKDGTLGVNFDGVGDIALEVVVVVQDLHGTTTQHIAGTNHDGVAQLVRLFKGLRLRASRATSRLANVELVEEIHPAIAILGLIDGLGTGTPDAGVAVSGSGGDGALFESLFKIHGQLEGGLTTELDNNAFGALGLDDVEDILQGDGLKVETGRGVVIGGDGLRVAVHHDGLEALVAEGEGSMAAAVVELNTLANTVGTTAKDQDLAAGGGTALRGTIIGGVHVGGVGLELGGAGIDALEGGNDIQGVTTLANLLRSGAGVTGNLAVTEALLLETAELLKGQLVELLGLGPDLGFVEVTHLG